MSTNASFLLYQKQEIQKLITKYNLDLVSLKNNYNRQLYLIKTGRNSNTIKNRLISNLVADYNAKVVALNKKLNADIQYIQNLKPPTPTVTQQVSLDNCKALLIGINYKGTQSELYGCINDVQLMKEELIKRGFKESNIVIITDDTILKPKKVTILDEFKKLLINAKTNDRLFFMYSGHGSYTRDLNGDEKTGYDQMICPIDFNMIVDDELKTYITNYFTASNTTMISLFDSCFSGSVLDLRYQYYDSLTNNVDSVNNKETETKNNNVIMISGSSDVQTSADTVVDGTPRGAVTWSFLETLKGNQNDSLTWEKMLLAMREFLKTKGYSQIPQLSSGKQIDIKSKVFI